MAATHGFMVVEFSVRSPKITITCFTDFEAKVYIIKGNSEVFFIQAAHFLKDAFAHHKAGCGDGGEVLDKYQSAEIANRTPEEVFVAVTGHTSQPHNNSGMLKSVI